MLVLSRKPGESLVVPQCDVMVKIIAIKDLITAIHGGKVPTTVNVIDKNHPLIITAKTLKTATGFKPDWALTGKPGGKPS